MLLMVTFFYLSQEYVWINIYKSKYVTIFLVQTCLFM